MGFYDHYANRSRNGLGVRMKRAQALRIFNLGLKGLKSGAVKVLELGPGDGYIAALSKSKGYTYTGVEGSEAVAQKLIHEGHAIIQSFVPPLPAATGSFDVCYMLHIIEHMKDMDTAVALVRGIRKGLPENGNLVIACPDYKFWSDHFYDCDYTHQLPFTRRRLAMMLSNEGFEVTYQSIYTGPVFGYRGLPLYWLAKLLFPRFLDEILSRYLRNDIAARAFFTFLPNLILVATKRS